MHQSGGRATVRDVASRAGVSPKTVSNVVNGTVAVSEETRARVEQAVAELNYVPNLSARGLRNGRTGVIAVALPDLNTAYSAEVAQHFVELAGQRGLSVQFEETHGDGVHEAQLLSRVRSHLIDGLILNPVRLETSAVQSDTRLPPVVLIGEVHQPIADHVWTDNVAACRSMVELLIAEGHRRIVALGVMEAESAAQRIQGYREALAAAGIPRQPELELVTPAWTAADAATTLSRFLATEEPPDAVFCMTDSMAVGALNALWATGLRVPEDVSVTGYDNVWESEYSVPPLTTIDFHKRQMCEVALDLLAKRIVDNSRPSQSVTIPHEIIRRSSVRSRTAKPRTS